MLITNKNIGEKITNTIALERSLEIHNIEVDIHKKHYMTNYKNEKYNMLVRLDKLNAKRASLTPVPKITPWDILRRHQREQTCRSPRSIMRFNSAVDQPYEEDTDKESHKTEDSAIISDTQVDVYRSIYSKCVRRGSLVGTDLPGDLGLRKPERGIVAEDCTNGCARVYDSPGKRTVESDRKKRHLVLPSLAPADSRKNTDIRSPYASSKVSPLDSGIYDDNDGGFQSGAVTPRMCPPLPPTPTSSAISRLEVPGVRRGEQEELHATRQLAHAPSFSPVPRNSNQELDYSRRFKPNKPAAIPIRHTKCSKDRASIITDLNVNKKNMQPKVNGKLLPSRKKLSNRTSVSNMW